jgi:disulfide oxidoreductase YuzD
VIESIREVGLVYPVTVVDGDVRYDGVVSYPAIMRAVEERLAERNRA